MEKIGIDTNIIIRILTNDDKKQAEKSRQLIAMNQIFISNTVILETEWVLRYSYKLPQADICKSFIKLFGLPNIHLENRATINKAIQWCIAGLDFADALHLASTKNLDKFYTFDQKLLARSKSLDSIQVLKP